MSFARPVSGLSRSLLLTFPSRIEDLHFGDSTGTLKTVNATSFQCSANAPCPGIDLYNNTFTVFGEEGQEADGHLCSEVLDPNFECTSGCGPENAWCPSF